MRPFGVCLILSLFLLLLGPCSCETDTLLQGQHLKDGQELVSAFRIFKLGFFSPGNSTKRYLGIWYNSFYLHANSKYDDPQERNAWIGYRLRPSYLMYGQEIYVQEKNDWISTQNDPISDRSTVWIANRNDPVSDRSGRLTIDSLGKLKILLEAANPVELSSTETTANTTLTLLDSGNLVLQEIGSDGSVKRILWQSFDYPTDTLLPGMRIGINSRTGKRWELTSWLEDDSPASGSFTLGMDPNITNRLIILWRKNIYWASGLWFNGLFTSQKDSERNYFSFSFVSNESEKYFLYSTNRYDATFPRIVIDPQGVLKIISLGGKKTYVDCSSLTEGNKLFGCEQPLPNCWPFYNDFTETIGPVSSDGFVLNETIGRLSSYDCRIKCLRNCSCLAYAYTNEDGKGCEIWSREPTLNRSSSLRPRNIFVRRSRSTPGSTPEVPQEEKKEVWLVVAASVVLTVPILCLFIYLVLRKFKMKVTVIAYLAFNFLKQELIPRTILGVFSMLRFIQTRLQKLRANAATEQEMLLRELGIDTRRRHRRSIKKDHQLQFLSFESVALATDNFSDENKLGEGGFGPVYKGKLEDGQEVAIKRLSKGSGQGLVEFKNEATLIAKLQHTNLVQLVGCCIEKEEKMLIYEYMPNKSLDFFLFDPLRRNVLDWKMRFSIIEGIIQGLLYLHKYSRLRVIHRDIKAGNILLDEEMNPKISDFGMARIFGARESKANTSKVAGTYGYMSPEYVTEGLFSTKSDVYSFGVLLLEIVTGRKNNSFQNCEGPLNLVVHAWDLWRENRVWELIDPSLGDSSFENPDVLRCIQVALLCVQGNAADRPPMFDVVSMIYSDVNALPSPKQPAFYNGFGISSPEVETERPEPEIFSTNRATVTDIEAR